MDEYAIRKEVQDKPVFCMMGAKCPQEAGPYQSRCDQTISQAEPRVWY
jgi:hypothetical protein